MEETEYQKQVLVAYPECDIHNRWKISSLMRQIQQVSGEHLETIGLGHRKLWNEGFVYLLTRIQLTIVRRPRAMETICIRTKPQKPRGAQSFREVLFQDVDGYTVATAQTAWVLVDPVEHRIRRPSEMPYNIPIGEDAYDYSWAREKLHRPQEALVCGTRTVRYSDLDVNLHLNNAVYSDIICDSLPFSIHQEKEWKKYTLVFDHEAKLGEELKIWINKDKNNKWYIGADLLSGKHCFEATVEFTDSQGKE